MNFKLFIAFFLLIGAINAVPTKHLSERTTTCNKQCLNHENNLFKEIGLTHHYNYETTSEIELENGQKTNVQIRAKVEISTVSPCEHQMHLRKVQIDGPKEARLMQQQIERHSTKFSQDNSRIESICFDENEETWVLNLKKAILSTIQVSVREQTEEIVEKDVLGYCDTKYEKISSNTLKKTKFLSTCTKRSKNLNSILTGDFTRSKRSICKIQLEKNDQVKSVVCEENNSMLPFAHSKASSHISTSTKLTLVKTEKRLSETINKQLIRDNLTFNKKHYNRHTDQDLKEVVRSVEQILDDIQNDIQKNVQKETPEKIKQLSRHLSVLNVQELERLAEKVSRKNDKVQDIFFDTVAQTGTQETAHLALKVIVGKKYYQGEVSKVRSAFWLSMLSNVENVDEEILSIALEHINNDNLPRQALLAITGMINEIKDEQEIKQDSRYRQVVNALVEKLTRETEEKEKIVILKALRNTGVHHDLFEQILKIAQHQSKNVETRIAAIQALEQHVSEERFYQKLFKIFENQSNEAELRIAAFQILVNNQEKVHHLYNVLKTESNKQVGSYVVSFFKNARESQLNEFETLRRIVSTFDLPEKKFQRNDFRQSRHVQFTQQINRLNVGAQVEADLVFDEQKQLRNVRARFDLNKENLQMKSVEITLRQNGLPEVAQQMVQKLTQQMNVNEIVDEVKEFTSIRSKEQLNHRINRLVNLLNLNKIDLSNRRLDEIDASIHLRVQDKTVLYINLKDIQEFSRTLKHQYNQREQIFEQIFNHLKGDNAFTFILASKQHKMPTAHGLPVHSGHKLVVVAALKNQNGEFYPSVASDFHYEMGFTLMNQRPSVQYHFQMHSAPGLKLNVEHKNGVPTKFSVSMPEDRLEILSVKSAIKLQTVANTIEELNVQKNTRNSCTHVLDKVLGVKVCYQAVHPENLIEKDALNFLSNGPLEMHLYLEKSDKSFRQWEVTVETPFSQHSGQAKILHLAFNTPGSRINRHVSMKVELQNEKDSKVMHIDLTNPIKSAKIEARYHFNQHKIGLKTTLRVDGQSYEAEIGGEKTQQDGEQLIKPTIRLVVPGMRKLHYTGRFGLINSGKKENLVIELKDSMTNKHFIKASIIKSGKFDSNENFKLATDLQAFWFTGSSMRFVSNVDKSQTGISSDLEIIHLNARQSPTTYKWKVALKDLSNQENKKYKADLELNVPNTDFENFQVSWNFVNRIEQEIENELEAFWNNQNGQRQRQVHILQQLKMNKASAKISSLWENYLKIEVIPFSAHYEVQAKTNWQRTQQKYNVQLTARDVQTNKQYKGEMSYQLPETRPLNFNVEARINIENNEFKLVHKIEEQQTSEYHGQTLLQLKKGQHIEMNYVYKMKEHSLNVPRLHHELDAEIKVPSKSITIKHKSALKLNSNLFELRHALRKNNVVVSDVKIILNKKGQSQLNMDNQLFLVNVIGDLSNQQNKQVNVELKAKQHQYHHQTKLNWSGKQLINLKSKTTKNQQEIADISIDYQRNQKAEAVVSSKLGNLIARHQHNGQEWATFEIESNYFSRPIKQQFKIEKNSNNRYTIKSKTHQNQQVIGNLDLQVESNSPSSLKIEAFDWKITGKTNVAQRQSNEKLFNIVLENQRKNLREELVLKYENQLVKVEFKHLNNEKRTTRLFGQVSKQESKLQWTNEHTDLDFSMKPIGQEKNVRLVINDKKHNLHHQSEVINQGSNWILNIDHSKNNQNVLKHNTKLSMNEDSYTKTETKKFTAEANYRRNSAVEIKFEHQNGLKHSTTIQIVDLRNKIAKIESSTSKNGERILSVVFGIDSLKKINIEMAHKQDKEMNFNVNLNGQQKEATLKIKAQDYEIKSNWQRGSKDHQFNLDVVDNKHDSTYNLIAHHQRKTMLNVRIENRKNSITQSAELKLHKSGEAFFKVNGENLKLNTELDFVRSPAEAKLSFENKRDQIKHKTTITFLKQQNELKINSMTEKRSKRMINVDFRINPTTKQLFASGEIKNSDLKIEANVNRRFTVELNEKSNQFKHSTVLDLNSRSLRSETIYQNEEMHKLNLRMVNRRDIDGSAKIQEHEINLKTNEQNKEIKLDYSNKRREIRSTGTLRINRDLVHVKINADQRQKQVIDIDAKLRTNEDKSLDAKLNAFKVNSNVEIKLSKDNQIRANIHYQNKEKNQNLKFEIDTTKRSENRISAHLQTEEHNYSLKTEMRKESNQIVMQSELHSRNEKIGQFDTKLHMSGSTVDLNVNGYLTLNGKRSEIVYKLNNLNERLEHVLKVNKSNNYSYGYSINVHLKQGKFIVHLPNRVVEMRYDLSTQTNGHVLVNLAVLPNSQNQPNNIYTIQFDNLITMHNDELIVVTKSSVHHPEMKHPLEMQARVELRELDHQRPFVFFFAYDASVNQQNRVSTLFEIMNEQNVRVFHYNISHQNQPILDVHYRWAMNYHLVHHQVNWTVFKKNSQKMTGELLAQLNLNQRFAKIELNNKHKLQMNWEQSFDRKTIVQLKAQTDNLVRKTKLVLNKDNQVDITNYENERITSNYLIKFVSERNTLFAIELFNKHGKTEKVAFIQLVKDNLNYAKIHLKANKDLVYQVQNSVNHLDNKIRNVAKRHTKEISEILNQQYDNLRIDEQSENAKRLIKKAVNDLEQVADDYLRLLQKHLPNVFDFMRKVNEKINHHLRNVWNFNLEQKIAQITDKIVDQVKNVEEIQEKIQEMIEQIIQQFREMKQKFDHEVIVKLSNQIEEQVKDLIRSNEDNAEKVYQFLYQTLKHVKLHKTIEQFRRVIVNVKNQIKNLKLHQSLHNFAFNQQTSFQGKWDPKNGEIIGQIYYPTSFSRWFN